MDRSFPPVSESAEASRCAYLLAAILLGQAIWIGLPGFRVTPLVLIAFAITLCVLGLLWRGGVGLGGLEVERLAGKFATLLLVVGVGAGFVELPWWSRFFGYEAGDRTFYALATLAALLALGAVLSRSRSSAIGCFTLLIAVHALMGAWYLSLEPGQSTDVLLVQQLGSEALTNGRNPYTMTFPDRYGPGANIYPPGLVVNGQVQSGFCYLPLSLLMDLPGYTLGEVRYSHLIAIELSAVLVALARPGRWAFGPAVLLLMMPGTFYLIKGAWLEPFSLLLLCAVVFLASRERLMLSAAALGLFLVSKQYVVLALPAAWTLLPGPIRGRDALRLALIALATGCAVTLPLALADPAMFYHSITALHLGGLRQDSISFAAVLSRMTGWQAPLWMAAIATLPAAGFVIWRAPRTPASFAASVALLLMCAFAFSSLAFGNYYYLAAGALCLAAAVD